TGELTRSVEELRALGEVTQAVNSTIAGGFDHVTQTTIRSHQFRRLFRGELSGKRWRIEPTSFARGGLFFRGHRPPSPRILTSSRHILALETSLDAVDGSSTGT